MARRFPSPSSGIGVNAVVFAIDKGQERVGVNECVHGGVLIGEVLFGIVTSTEPTMPDLHRHAAIYVYNILKGAKPADLPSSGA